MKYIIGILQRQWNINADDMEYMRLESPELDAALEEQRQIENAIIIQSEEVKEAISTLIETVEKNCNAPYNMDIWDKGLEEARELLKTLK